MVSLLFKDKRGVNLSCASPASAAVCTSLERRSMVRPSITRAVDIYSRNPARRPRASNPKHQSYSKYKSQTQNNNNSNNTETQKAELASPAGSSRYLLNENSSVLMIPELDSINSIVPSEKKDHESASYMQEQEEIEVLRTCSSARQDQVVVLRVSLHCKGCEGKVRRHISKMEGVTSFEIDLTSKKVTIVGNVTPLGVLNSVSKVKNAQFWPLPPRASASF